MKKTHALLLSMLFVFNLFGQKNDADLETKMSNENKKTVSDWGWGFDISGGYGLFTGNLSENFQNYGTATWGIDIYYRRFLIAPRVLMGWSSVKNDIPYNENDFWTEDSKAGLVVVNANFGYAALDSKIFKITPTVGIGIMDISPTSKDKKNHPDLKNAELKWSANFSAGVNFDIKFHNPNLKSNAKTQDTWAVRLRYECLFPQFIGFKGTLHNITVGITGFGQNVK